MNAFSTATVPPMSAIVSAESRRLLLHCLQINFNRMIMSSKASPPLPYTLPASLAITPPAAKAPSWRGPYCKRSLFEVTQKGKSRFVFVCYVPSQLKAATKGDHQGIHQFHGCTSGDCGSNLFGGREPTTPQRQPSGGRDSVNLDAGSDKLIWFVGCGVMVELSGHGD